MSLALSDSLFDQQLLNDDLARLLPQQVKLLYLDTCDSTNKQCMQMGSDGLVVVSEHQTEGRGRRGKHWHSPQRQNLYCSIGLSKSLSPEYLGLISLLVGVSIADVLHQAGFNEVSLKWPNDVLMDGKKLGGILIETRAIAATEFYLVIGVGVNLALDDDQLRQIDQPATALSQNNATDCDYQQLVTSLISRVFLSVREFEPSQADALLERFKAYDHLIDKPVLVKTLNEDILGHYVGLQADGQVCVSLADGIRSFAAAEISIRETVKHVVD
jgi:BirA family transcriptional regulator, biotin operon repressor / biotin---[acetyl-CoA-carboxylase] ligase